MSSKYDTKNCCLAVYTTLAIVFSRFEDQDRPKTPYYRAFPGDTQFSIRRLNITGIFFRRKIRLSLMDMPCAQQMPRSPCTTSRPLFYYNILFFKQLIDITFSANTKNGPPHLCGRPQDFSQILFETYHKNIISNYDIYKSRPKIKNQFKCYSKVFFFTYLAEPF